MVSWKRNFLTVATGQTVSLIGSSAVQFALIWWLASETASPMVMALSGLVAFLPQLLLGPFAGVWIDRFRRKTVVISADLFMGVVALVFAAFFVGGAPPYWSALLVLGVRAVGGVFHTPAIQSIIPQLVPAGELVRANGWSQFMQSGAFMLGPVLGALMYGALPLSVILLTDFLGAVVASLTVASVKVPEPQHNPAGRQHFFHEMREGAHVLVRDKRLLTATLCAAVCMVFFMPLSSYYPLMTSSYFGLSQMHGGIVEFSYAAGMMLFALLISRKGQIADKLKFGMYGLLGIGATSAVCGLLPPTMWAYCVFALVCAVMGGCGNVYGVPVTAYMQETVPPEAQGRVFSLFGSLMSLTMPLGLLLSGPVAQRYGVKTWFLITGLAVMATVLLSLWLMRRQKRGQITKKA